MEVELGNSSGKMSSDTPAIRTPSPDRAKCAICLGDLVNKSYSNTCINHEFCFGCLLEWSKVKPECPLCKSTFRSIIYNIRNDSDYDEYVVPTPIPALSIRVSAATRSPEIFLRNSNYFVPYFGDRQMDRVTDRLRTFSPHWPSPISFAFGSSQNDSIDVTLSGAHHHSSASVGAVAVDANPFAAEMPEYFGGALDLVRRSRIRDYSSHRIVGYQGRRRRYDRSQWVQPFHSTLAPGTVFFPSVEYFQRHPTTMRRITPWLHRELSVLMSLTSSRSQMAFAFDLVNSLLLRYDIRSAEFRDLMQPYLGSKTRQFQHEFYYFVLSGLRMEEYDNTAQYTSAPVPSHRSQSPNRLGLMPPNDHSVVTLDSDEDVVVDNVSGSNYEAATSSSTARASARSSSRQSVEALSVTPGLSISIPSVGEDSDGSPVGHPVDLSDIGAPMLPSVTPRPEILQAYNAIDNEIARLRNRSRLSGRDPDMPILEPQVNLNNLSSPSNSPSAFTRLRVGPGSNRREETLNSLFHNYPPRAPPELHDQVDGRRSPYPDISNSPPLPGLANYRSQSSSSLFPLSLLETVERRQSLRTEESSFERPQIHNSSSEQQSRIPVSSGSPSVQIRIYPSAMDLSTQGIGHHFSSESRLGRSNSVIQMRPRTPLRPPTPEGECEFLGVHPIIKKPPLDVITLTSEDEDDVKPLPIPQDTTESRIISVTQGDEQGTSSSIRPRSFVLPPRRRISIPSEFDSFGAALLSLPQENLIDRHMNSIPSSSSKKRSKCKCSKSSQDESKSSSKTEKISKKRKSSKGRSSTASKRIVSSRMREEEPKSNTFEGNYSSIFDSSSDGSDLRRSSKSKRLKKKSKKSKKSSKDKES